MVFVSSITWDDHDPFGHFELVHTGFSGDLFVPIPLNLGFSPPLLYNLEFVGSILLLDPVTRP